MVEIKESFNVKLNKKGDLVLTNSVETTFSKFEAPVQLKKIQNQIMESVNKESLISKQIEGNVLEKEFNRTVKKIHMLKNIGEQIEKIIDVNVQGHDLV